MKVGDNNLVICKKSIEDNFIFGKEYRILSLDSINNCLTIHTDHYKVCMYFFITDPYIPISDYYKNYNIIKLKFSDYFYTKKEYIKEQRKQKLNKINESTLY